MNVITRATTLLSLRLCPMWYLHNWVSNQLHNCTIYLAHLWLSLEYWTGICIKFFSLFAVFFNANIMPLLLDWNHCYFCIFRCLLHMGNFNQDTLCSILTGNSVLACVSVLTFIFDYVLMSNHFWTWPLLLVLKFLMY